MAERAIVSVRLHARVEALLRETMADRHQSMGFLIEEMAVQMYGAKLAGFEPGQKADGEDGRNPISDS